MTYFIAIILIAFVSAQTKVDLGSKPVNQKAVSFEKHLKIIDEEEGFYDETITTVSENGTIFLYDVGNKTMIRYNKDGKMQNSFGKEGNGPGEFNQFVFGAVAGNDILVVRAGRKIQLFKHDGTLIKEIVDFALAQSLIEFKDSNILFHSAPMKISKNRVVIYNNKGELVKEKANPEFDQKELAEMSPQSGFGDEKVKKMLKMPNSMILHNGGFIVGYSEDYRFHYVDQNHALKKIYSRDYDRQKIKEIMDILPRFQKRMYNSMKSNPQAKKMFMQVTNSFSSNMGGYFGDVKKVLGSYKGHLFVQTSADDINSIKVDVISPDEKLLSILEIESKDELLTTNFENGKLIGNYSSEEEGPYAVIYNVKMN